MCDEDTAADNKRHPTALARGQSDGEASATELDALLPSPANAVTVAGCDATIKTPDGVCDAWFVAPTTGKHPGVLVWPDVMGLRPAFQQMGRRLAESGYAVLVVNQFYRSANAPFVKPGEEFSQPEVRARLEPWRDALTPAGTVSDAEAYVTWLDQQEQVDQERGIASTGYCGGGPMAMRTAAARNDRVRAGASFHGASLATEKADSPHLLVPRMKAEFLFAVAQNDDERHPQEKDLIGTAFAAAKLTAEIEVYPGAMHGWCPPDNRVHNHAQAERAWARHLALFQRALCTNGKR